MWFKRPKQGYPLHQHEEPVYQPEREIVISGPRVRAWVASQLRAMGYEVAPTCEPRQTGAITPIPPVRETGALPPVPRSPRTVNSVSDIPTAKQLPGLPPYMVAKLKPVAQADIDLDKIAQDIADVPTSIDMDERVARALANSGPLPDDSWLTAPVPPIVAGIQYWTAEDAPVLKPLYSQELASADRTASFNPLGVTAQDCAPVLQSPEDSTKEQETPALYQMRLLARKREEN